MAIGVGCLEGRENNGREEEEFMRLEKEALKPGRAWMAESLTVP